MVFDSEATGAVGLEVACPPPDPDVAGSNPGEVGRNFRMRKFLGCGSFG